MNEMTNSHILLHEFDYLEPATLAETSALLQKYGDRARVLAGGTDLLVQMKMERVAPGVLLGLRRLEGLAEIGWHGRELWIGALASIRTVRDDPEVRRHFRALADACALFSTTQVQVMGTIGGNLCNGSPASDTAPALIALDAQVHLHGPAGERSMPVAAFFRGPGLTDLRTGELLVRVSIPESRPGSGSAFLKIARVSADLAKASVALNLTRADDRIVDCRLAYGAVASTPRRARQAEAVLTGQCFSPELLQRAARAAAAETAPITDVRSTAEYRRHVVAVLTQDGLAAAWERAGEPPSQFDSATHSAPARSTRVASMRDRPSEPSAAGPVAGKRLRPITMTVNGQLHGFSVAPNELLLNVLRETMELTGTKYGCGIGECSACTVQMDGKPVLACLVLAVAADGADILTVEGLQGPDGRLDPLQEAFLAHAAFQCGYCTPGMLMTAKSLLADVPRPSEADVRDYLKGNLCRCTGYAAIVRAVLAAGGEK